MKVGSERVFALGLLLACVIGFPRSVKSASTGPSLFEPSARCIACHNGLVTPLGEDASIGFAWQPTMMANAARDPYWQASVRREVMAHPTLANAIQDECSKCHLPMATTNAHTRGGKGEVFKHFDAKGSLLNPTETTLARDGVSCTLCHQIQSTNLGKRQSLVGGFVIDVNTPAGRRKAFGPYIVDDGRAELMRSASRFVPIQGSHLSSSEFCATCHTLYTHSVDTNGRVIGELPEQVPYQEWLHSAYRTTRSCQTCHMPPWSGPIAISSVAGPSRQQLFRHDFVGGNFFIQELFGRFGSELLTDARPTNFVLAAQRTREHLSRETARVEVKSSQFAGGRLKAVVIVTNLAGHKLPTAYPSRRVWLHVTIRSGRGKILFESGALRDDGSIVGNDNDADATRFEPHYTRIERSSEVAIYESILGRPDGSVTTELLAASRYVKDNRLLPSGFDKTTAHADIAVHGAALSDPDFQAGRDVVLYEVPLDETQGPFEVEAELLYQPIGRRWAANLRNLPSDEPQRFTRYFDALSRRSAVVLDRM